LTIFYLTFDTMPSVSTTATLAALAASCPLLFYGASRLTKKEPTAPSFNDIDEIDDDDVIAPDDVVAIFDKLFLQMQNVVMQLSQQVQQLQMAGQMIPEKQLRQLLKGEFERALTQLQAQVFEDNDVDADCLEEATWEFLENEDEYPKVKKAVERFQKLYDSISGEEVAGWRPGTKKDSGPSGATAASKDLSPEELLKAATIYFETITKKMVEIAKNYKEEGRDLKNPQVSQQFQMEASTDANEAAEDAMKETGVTMADFRKALDKHSRIPTVGQTLAMLQMKQQQELMASGIPMM